jgi:hypothetical protein
MPASDSKETPPIVTSKSAYIAMLYSLPVLLLFIYLGKWETGIGAWICTGLVLLIIRIRWDLRRHVWFWIAIVFAALLQVPFVLLVPWNNRSLTGISLLPIGVLDYAIIYGLIKLIEKMVQRVNKPRSLETEI